MALYDIAVKYRITSHSWYQRGKVRVEAVSEEQARMRGEVEAGNWYNASCEPWGVVVLSVKEIPVEDESLAPVEADQCTPA